MVLQSLFHDLASLRIGLLILGAVLALVAYLRYRAQRKRKQDLTLPEPVAADPNEAGTEESQAGISPSIEHTEQDQLGVSENWTGVLEARPSIAARAMRIALIFLALLVAAGFVLILLPPGTLDKIVQSLRASRAAELPPEKIALLYLGDEIRGKEFHIRGVVRNIGSEPVEKLDATVRLYSSDGSLLETVVVRMHLDTIAPDATSEFHLLYPNYAGQFGSYSVDFKLRHGEVVPYKDRRGTRHLN